MKIFLAADHAGYELKNILASYLRELGHVVTDFGALVLDPEDDYPEVVRPCAEKVATEKDSFGIILGSSGQGEAMVANRVHGIRAAVFYGGAHAPASLEVEGTRGMDEFDIIRVARMHNNANILSLGARFISEDTAKKAVKIFLETQFSSEARHARRIGEF